jgi:hypothetical protein
METRSTIKELSKNESISHTGDLAIDGDVSENAEVTVIDGSLTILGSVKDGAKITVKLSEELMKSTAMSQVAFGSIVMYGGGNVTVRHGSFTSCLMSVKKGSTEVMIGDVNIDHRIFTDDQVAKLGSNKYKVTPVDNNDFAMMFMAINKDSKRKLIAVWRLSLLMAYNTKEKKLL